MGATYFDFKQFRVEQDRCAMKVCTDSCLFGAFTVAHFKNKRDDQSTVLDIGGGTGLLSLMLAQQTDASIHAAEIDKEACRQMKENFENAAFENHLYAHCTDIKRWESDLKFDLIISNPPFFENNLKSTNAGRSRAMHHDDLSFKTLAAQIHLRLKPGGAVALLLPWYRADEMCSYMQEMHLYNYRSTNIRQSTDHSFFRSILFFSWQENATVGRNEMAIKDRDGAYTREFRDLLRDYYLGF